MRAQERVRSMRRGFTLTILNVSSSFSFHIRGDRDVGSEADRRDVVAGDMKVKEVFGVNYPKLQILKGKYDPGLLFDKTHVIQPVFK